MVQDLASEQAAATTIQAFARGFLIRNHHKTSGKEMKTSFEDNENQSSGVRGVFLDKFL